MIAKEKNRATVELVSDTEILISRAFDAPRDLVFEAMTRPEHVRHWYGCSAMTMTACEIDLRVGGKWRYVLRMPDGSEHGFHGEYREIVAPARIVSTENYEPIGPGHEMVATVTLEDKGGRTLFKNLVAYRSKQDRDGHLQSGMETGMQESFDRLEAIVTR
ncbi:MAG TPA: SRPBCC family protein [Polyangiaceae bacterium]|nr:SRPBCC family protein [Polyangiaceae bacterium]